MESTPPPGEIGLIYQLKANLGENIFDKVTYNIDPEIWKMLACLGTRNPYSILVHDLLAFFQLKILCRKLSMETSMAHKSCTRMERGILNFHTNPFPVFSNC